MAGNVAPNIVTDGLVLYLDAANTKSIPLDPTVNQVLWSQNFSQSVWSKSTYDTLTTGSSAPDGTPTATLVDETNAYLHPATFAQFSTIRANGTTITYSIYTKKGTATSRSFLLRNNTTSTNFTGLSFQYSISSSAAGWTVQDVGDGWFRLAYTQTTGITPGDMLAVYAGRTGAAASGSTATWYLWGAQVESTPYATPYIQSTSTLGGRNTWGDLSGNNNNATLATASISSSIPQYSYLNERVLNFDGTGSFAIMPDGAYTNFGSGDFSFTTWIRRTSDSGFIFGSQTTNTFIMYHGFGNIAYGRGNVGLDGTFTNTNFPLNRWTCLAMIKSNNTMSLYSNGILMQQQPNTSSYVQGTSNFVIGKNPSSNITFLAGQIGNYKIYNRALTAQEVLQNYNTLKGRFGL